MVAPCEFIPFAHLGLFIMTKKEIIEELEKLDISYIEDDNSITAWPNNTLKNMVVQAEHKLATWLFQQGQFPQAIAKPKIIMWILKNDEYKYSMEVF